MKRGWTAIIALATLAFCATGSLADTRKGGKVDGKKEFQEHCAVCHVNGGNIVNPAKTLSRKDREANGVKTAADIVGKMRNPGAGMTMFDKKTVSDKEARAIADYIIKTFK